MIINWLLKSPECKLIDIGSAKNISGLNRPWWYSGGNWASHTVNPSWNPDEADNFYFVKIAWKNKEDSGIG